MSFEAARQVVAEMQSPTATWPCHGQMEAIEAVHVGMGWSASEVVPGIEMRWRQGSNLYGLLMPLDRLVSQAGDLAGVPFYLRLAVDEPNGEVPNGTRLWFQDLPSGPY
ncbi:MAG: hypothetical protein JO291_12065 [Acidimicrobiia bacterium]|nr:hypothetical protein [Acidimicrobiia bacterium]